MKKLALDLESLRVESFETLAAAGGRGTVHALESQQTCLGSECWVDPSAQQGTCPHQTCMAPPPTQGSTPECCL